jgi:hypothetical protein
LKLADELGIVDFKASGGWLDKFKARHSIVFKGGGKLQRPCRAPNVLQIRRHVGQRTLEEIKAKKSL